MTGIKSLGEIRKELETLLQDLWEDDEIANWQSISTGQITVNLYNGRTLLITVKDIGYRRPDNALRQHP